MVYSNYLRSYNNMISRMQSINSFNNYVSGINSSNSISSTNKLLNSVLNNKKNDYVNNIKKYAEYDKSSKEFYNEFKDKFSELKESAEKLKSYSSDSVFVKRYNRYDSTSEINSGEGSSSQSLSDKSENPEDENTKIFSAVQKFATNYNDAVTFLNNNKDKSINISNLAHSYTSIVKYNKSTLSGIGINVDANGKLTINKDKLENAIKENRNTVRNALGDSTSGVANKIYNKTTVAMIQSKELYPASKLKNDYINNTYFYNPNNSSILQANQMYSSGLFLNLLL